MDFFGMASGQFRLHTLPHCVGATPPPPTCPDTLFHHLLGGARFLERVFLYGKKRCFFWGRVGSFWTVTWNIAEKSITLRVFSVKNDLSINKWTLTEPI